MLKKIIYVLIGILVLMLIPLVIYTHWDLPLEQLKAKYANENSKFIEVDGMSVHYREEGKGFPLVLIHGTGASLHTWDAWTQVLKKDFRVIRLDLPAFGLTGPHPQSDYSLANYTKFLHNFLQKIKVEACYMAGNSLGGTITWEYALAYPQEIKKMILLDLGGYPSTRKIPWVFQIARTPVINNVIRYVTPRSIYKSNLEQVYYEDSKISEDLITRYFELSLREGNRQAFIERSKTQGESNWRRLKEIKTPTLIQWGKEDAWIPVNLAEKFKADLPNAELKIYEKVGHIPMEESPGETVKDALIFLKK